jgi:hypothetical protein
MRETPPPDRPDEADQPDWRTRLDRARRFWQFCLFLPFVYLLVGWGAEALWFPGGKKGLWPSVDPSLYRGILSLLGGVVFGAQTALMLIRKRHADLLDEAADNPDRMAKIYWRRTLYMAGCSDLVSFFGLLGFLVKGHWFVIVGLCGFSYILYAQAYPRAILLDRPEE